MGKRSGSKKRSPAKIAEQRKRSNWKKIFTILSLSTILVATVGFSIVGHKNITIDKMRKKLSASEEIAKNAFYDLKDTLKEYDKAMLMRNHIDILSNIKAESALIDDRKIELINILKNAVVGAYAIAVKLPDKNAQKEWRDLDSYNKLFPVYMKYLLKSEQRIKNAQKTNSLEKQLIESMSNSMRNWNVILVVLNSIGLILGVLASFFHSNEVESLKKHRVPKS